MYFRYPLVWKKLFYILHKKCSLCLACLMFKDLRNTHLYMFNRIFISRCCIFSLPGMFTIIHIPYSLVVFLKDFKEQTFEIQIKVFWQTAFRVYKTVYFHFKIHRFCKLFSTFHTNYNIKTLLHYHQIFPPAPTRWKYSVWIYEIYIIDIIN